MTQEIIPYEKGKILEYTGSGEKSKLAFKAGNKVQVYDPYGERKWLSGYPIYHGERKWLSGYPIHSVWEVIKYGNKKIQDTYFVELRCLEFSYIDVIEEWNPYYLKLIPNFKKGDLVLHKDREKFPGVWTLKASNSIFVAASNNKDIEIFHITDLELKLTKQAIVEFLSTPYKFEGEYKVTRKLKDEVHKKCSCSMDILMSTGCKCGQMERER